MIRSIIDLTATVDRLPPGVLAGVLGFHHDDRDLISTTHVCGRWRSTLLSTPLLWTEVVFDGNPDRSSAYLERSKDGIDGWSGVSQRHSSNLYHSTDILDY